MDTESLEENTQYFNIEIEKQLLGLILIQNQILIGLEQELTEDSFYANENKIFFKTIKNLIQNDKQADTQSLYYSVAGNQDLNQYTNEELKTIVDGLISWGVSCLSSPKQLTKILNSLSLKREFICYRNKINEFISGPNEQIEEKISNIEQEIYSIINKNKSQNNYNKLEKYTKILSEKLQKARKSDKTILGIQTGLKDLDNYTGGLQKSDLIIIAARPSMGKTALATTIAKNVATILQKNQDENEKQQSIVVFSLEMSGEQLAARLIAMDSGFNVKTIHTGRYDEYDNNGNVIEENKKIEDRDWNKICKSMQNISNLPLYIDDTPALNISILRSRARYMKSRHNVCAIIIDYLQLLKSSKNYNGNRVLEIAEITSNLKAIAKELDIPVVALSQLSRAVEGRDDKKPQLSDLRESGTIEQDADIVMFLYREEYYEARKEPKVLDGENEEQIKKYSQWKTKYDKIKNIAEIIVAKNRNGPVGTVLLSFDKEHMVFTGADKYYYETIKENYTENDNDNILNKLNENEDKPSLDEGYDDEE